MLILDACVGAEKIYQGMNKLLKENFISIDIRKGDFKPELGNYKYLGENKIIINPTILADMKYLPFKDETFDVIIMDPPHYSFGKNCKTAMALEYGSWTKQDKIVNIYNANKEFKRCLKKNGTLIIKVMSEDKDRYINLFNNFIFYLPIQTIRDRGCMSSKEAKLAAIWLIGILKDR